MKECMTITSDGLQELKNNLLNIYDVVRIVEPRSNSVVDFEGDHIVKSQMEPCFAVWEKEERCSNCASLRACIENRRMTKFEFCNDEVYSVVSMPVKVQAGEREYILSLELVNHVVGEMIMQARGQGLLTDEVARINHKVYEDSLTGVFNRRYYDENQHIYEMVHTIPQKLSYLVVDVNRFKHVNDVYGHARGDELLIQVAETLRRNVRESDKVIRIGGDEFLVVIKDCSKIFAEKKVNQIKRAITQIDLDWMGEFRPSAAVGMAYTDSFTGSEAELHKLFSEADERMYQNKTMPVEEKKQMLIVDDIEVARTVLKNFFQNDFEIFEAEDGVQALDILRKNPIEIVITDIYMPNMDGITLTKTIRNTTEINNIVIFVMTDRGEDNELQALEAGADDFINKPFNPELLNHRIKGVLSQNTVLNRISQYQLSFNQNQIPFATVKVENNLVTYEYVNDAFVQLMDATPEEFLSGRKHLHFKGFQDFVMEVSKTHKRNRMSVRDENTGNYYDMVAYAQDNGFCSFIILRNDALKQIDAVKEKHNTEFGELLTVNPNTLGALFIDLKESVCYRGHGKYEYFDGLKYPLSYDKLLTDLADKHSVDDHAKKRFLEMMNRKNLLMEYRRGKRNIGTEVPCKMMDGRVRWLEAYVKLSMGANGIEAILYFTDIHSRKLSEMLIDSVSSQVFDEFMCVDTISDTVQIYRKTAETRWTESLPLNQVAAEIEKSLQENYAGPDKEQFHAENKVKQMIEELQKKNSFQRDFELFEDGAVRKKRISAYWLDEAKVFLSICRQDITEISVAWKE